jgi:signal transduction histidine kinase
VEVRVTELPGSQEAAGLVVEPGRLLRIAGACGAGALALGATGLAGWIFGVPALQSVLPGLASMKANTAVGILLNGLALALAAVPGGRPRRAIATAAAALAMAIGALTLCEFLFHVDFHLDQAIFRDSSGRALPYYPGRMAPTTATCLVLAGAALLTARAGSARGRGFSRVAGLALFTIAVISAAGYLYGVRPIGVIAYHTTQMAVHTSAAFLLLSCGIALMRPAEGWVAVVLSRDAGGSIARRLLPAAVGVPLAGGLIFRGGQRAGWYGEEFVIAAVVVTTVLLTSAATCAAAARLGRADLRRRASEEELRRLNVELESRVAGRTAELASANRELEAFASAVSHDLAAPLRTIDGFAAALQKDLGPALAGDAASHVRRIRGAAQLMGARIEALLDLSHVGRVGMNREEIDLTAVARAVGEALRAAEPSRAVNFRVQPGMKARGDVRLVRALLDNLVGNAWKFTSKSSPANVEIGEEGAGKFFVRDNGAGFDPALASKLFLPFERLHSQEEYGGHGIGLATARRIAERHGGEIRAEGAPGAGATFRFTLGG